ncbi:hypothetical protein X737_31770 [Mesorhizobium sp. L48C026A00]|nr:hypothetical protein X737_31770 [Mesorhizobium sp. L48C026A00]
MGLRWASDRDQPRGGGENGHLAVASTRTFEPPRWNFVAAVAKIGEVQI